MWWHSLPSILPSGENGATWWRDTMIRDRVTTLHRTNDALNDCSIMSFELAATMRCLVEEHQLREIYHHVHKVFTLPRCRFSCQHHLQVSTAWLSTDLLRLCCCNAFGFPLKRKWIKLVLLDGIIQFSVFHHYFNNFHQNPPSQLVG